MRIVYLGLSLLFSVAVVSADAPTAGRQVEVALETEHGTIPYLLYLPKNYDSAETFPLMLFLHGRGESNGPLRLVEKWGPPRMASRGVDLPYVLISPQCPREKRWTSDDQLAMLLSLLDHVTTEFKIDAQRTYLTGLSMGGYGSWRLAADHASRFAAAAIICGGGDPATAPRLKDLPIWVFHGTKDTAVPFSKSVEMVDAIRKTGGEKIRFTSLEEIGHNSWSAAYATPELYTWLNKHTR